MKRIRLIIAGLKMEEPHDKECRWHLVAERRNQLTTSKDSEILVLQLRIQSWAT